MLTSYLMTTQTTGRGMNLMLKNRDASKTQSL